MVVDRLIRQNRRQLRESDYLQGNLFDNFRGSAGYRSKPEHLAQNERELTVEPLAFGDNRVDESRQALFQ
jgi:hypothetical protein